MGDVKTPASRRSCQSRAKHTHRERPVGDGEPVARPDPEGIPLVGAPGIAHPAEALEHRRGLRGARLGGDASRGRGHVLPQLDGAPIPGPEERRHRSRVLDSFRAATATSGTRRVASAVESNTRAGASAGRSAGSGRARAARPAVFRVRDEVHASAASPPRRGRRGRARSRKDPPTRPDVARSGARLREHPVARAEEHLAPARPADDVHDLRGSSADALVRRDERRERHHHVGAVGIRHRRGRGGCRCPGPPRPRRPGRALFARRALPPAPCRRWRSAPPRLVPTST